MSESGSLNPVKRHHFDLCTKASLLGDDDSMIQILARLPAKSLLRFKSVSKSWFSLISSDYFRRLHALCKPPPSLILTAFKPLPHGFSFMVEISDLFYYSRQVLYIKRSNEIQRIMPYISLGPFGYTVTVFRCCNGLLLLRNWRDDYYVYNPITHRSEKILMREYCFDAQSLHLLFDPLKSPHNYKIVCIPENQQQITAFDSESGMWRECVEGFTSGGKTCISYLIHRGLLYRFNIVKDYVSQFLFCPLPKLADQGQVYYDVLQESSNGSLYYCAFVESVATLWELQLNGGDPRCSKWLLKYHNSVPRLPALGVCMLAFIREASTVLIRVREKILAYSFVYKSYTELPLALEPFSSTSSIHYCVYVNHFGDTLP